MFLKYGICCRREQDRHGVERAFDDFRLVLLFIGCAEAGGRVLPYKIESDARYQRRQSDKVKIPGRTNCVGLGPVFVVPRD
jgi:hypothetical protein